MPITVGPNIASLMAQRRMAESSEKLSRTYERLSSGSRINRASDDAAGLAISTALNTGARVYRRGIKNIDDAISVHNIASSAIDNLQTLVTRISELAEQAANGTYSLAQRRALDREALALRNEFGRIVDTSKFNGRGVLNGDFAELRIQAGVGIEESISTPLGTSLQRKVGDGTFVGSLSLDVPSASFQFAPFVADLNHDGKNDILASTEGTRIFSFLGNGNGTFAASTSFQVSAGNSGVRGAVLTDVDNDGNYDWVGNGNSLDRFVWKLGNADGTFKATQSVPMTISSAFAIPVEGDFNGDGFADFVINDAAATEFLQLMNRGDGSFTVTRTFTGFTSITAMGVGDYNGDGRDDLSIRDNGQIQVRLGNGDGTFSAGSNIGSTAAGNFNLKSHDVDRDGFTDIVAVTSSSFSVSVMLSNGDGTFKAAISSSSPTGGGSFQGATFNDFNGDGYIDIGVGRNVALYEVFLGTGDGRFQSQGTTAQAAAGYVTSSGDLNGDGVPDPIGVIGLDDVNILFSNATNSSSLEPVNLLTREAALSTLESMKTVSARLLTERTAIGANLSRLETASRYIAGAADQYTASAGRIENADIAEESAAAVQSRILQQVGAAVLAQANLQPRIALQLLQD